MKFRKMLGKSSSLEHFLRAISGRREPVLEGSQKWDAEAFLFSNSHPVQEPFLLTTSSPSHLIVMIFIQ
jgi:hypothetical protein